MRFDLSLAILLLSTWALAAQASDKKKVVYKSHTQIDFTGDKIEGKVKAPAVFYIFQRKRSLGHEAARSPSALGFHEAPMKKLLGEAVAQ